MATHELDPISRIEGHLGVTLTTTGTAITDAHVHGNLWRGFENFMIGREPNDPITFTQRICGVCPLPHATASMFAADAVFGYSPGYMTFGGTGAGEVPAAAVHIRNLVYASEFVMSHITHFFHLAALSYVQGPQMPPWTPYFADSYYHPFLSGDQGYGLDALGGGYADLPDNQKGFSNDLWSAVIKAYVKALRARRLTFEAGALFAGRMPMVASFVAGGTTNWFDTGELRPKCKVFYDLMTQTGAFVVQEYAPIALALGVLYPRYDNAGGAIGAGTGNCLAWGAFPDPGSDTPTIQGGFSWGPGNTNPGTQLFMTDKSDINGTAAMYPAVFTGTDGSTFSATPISTANGTFSNLLDLVEGALTEDIAQSRYLEREVWGYGTTANGTVLTSAFPGDVNRTEPDRTSATKYSWLKAPRWMGAACEVGPFARMTVNNLYPAVTGGNLAASTAVAAFVATNTSGLGLNPALIGPDLAVSLVRMSAAQVLYQKTGASLRVPASTFEAVLSNATDIVNAYYNYNSVNLGGSPTLGTWTKATIVDGTTVALFTAIAGLNAGYSVMDRHRARMLECVHLIQWMCGNVGVNATTNNVKIGAVNASGIPTTGWIGRLAATDSACYPSSPWAAPTGDVATKMGVSEAPRGALAHFSTVEQGKISAYQCVVPTTWNASPEDGNNQKGPMESAMIGAPYVASTVTVGEFVAATAVCGVEALRIAQSFDPCIACAVH